MTDYTLRNVPEVIDERLRRDAAARGLSVEQAALEAIARGLGLNDLEFEYYELDELSGPTEDEPALVR